jgi:hypothetical protein
MRGWGWQAGCRAAVGYTRNGSERRFRKPAPGLGKRDPPAYIVAGTTFGTDEDYTPDFPGGPDRRIPAHTGADKRGVKPESIPAVRAGMEFVFNRQDGDFLGIGQKDVLLLMHWAEVGYQRFLRFTIAMMRSVAFFLPLTIAWSCRNGRG